MSEHRVTDATEAAALVGRLEEQGVRTVMIGGPDTPGMMRGKRFPVAQLPRILADGMVLCNVFWVIPLDESDLVQRPMGHVGYFPTEQNGYPDIIGIPDLRTARNVPWHADTALLLCDWELPHGAGLFGVSKVQAVGRGQRLSARHADVAGAFGHGQPRAAARAHHAVHRRKRLFQDTGGEELRAVERARLRDAGPREELRGCGEREIAVRNELRAGGSGQRKDGDHDWGNTLHVLRQLTHGKCQASMAR